MSYVIGNINLPGGCFPTLGAVSKVPSKNDLIADINADMVKAVGGALKTAANVLPLSATDKKLLSQQPLNYMLKVFSPVQGLVEKVIERVNKRSGKMSRKYNPLSSKKMDMRTVHPSDAAAQKASPQTFPFYKTLRTFGQYVAIVFTAPQLFTDELARELTRQPIGKGDVLFLPDLGRYNGRVGLGVAGGDDATVASITGFVTAVGPVIMDFVGPLLPGILMWMQESAAAEDAKQEEARLRAAAEREAAANAPPPAPIPTPTQVVLPTGVSPQVLIIGGVAGLLVLALVLKR